MTAPPTHLLDALPVSVACVGPDLLFAWANARLCGQLGRPLAGVVGRTAQELGIRPAEWGDWEQSVTTVRATGGPAEYSHHCTLHGAERLVHTKFALLPGADGRPPLVVAVAYFNDEVRQLRDSLSVSERKFQAFMEHVPAITWLRDADERFVFVNGEYTRHLGVSLSDRVGRHVTDVFPPDVAARLMANDARAVSGPVRAEEQVPDAAGEVRTWLNVKFTVPGPDGRPQYAGFGLDMTAEKKLEAEREALRDKLLIAQKAESLGVLAGGVAHDFNNLLTAVIGFAGLARSLAPAPTGPLTDCLTQIEAAAERAGELCRQMLAYDGRGQPARQAVDLSALARETVRLLTAGHLRGVAVTLDLAPDLPRVDGDPTQLRQVVLNLLTNAAEATAGRPTRAVTVSTAAAAGVVRLTVSDTGAGMDAATAARVFEPFFTTKPTGHGLGLAAVGEIVRGHGGSVRVVTDPGAGSTFEVELPAAARS